MYGRDAGEWLETDGLGGFACGTATTIRTRRYHGLLAAALNPPSQRMMLVGGLEAWVSSNGRDYSLTPQLYEPGVLSPPLRSRFRDFIPFPWPRWIYRLEDGTLLHAELFMPRGRPAVVLAFQGRDLVAGTRLHLRPLLAFRAIHELQRETSGLKIRDEAASFGRLWHGPAGRPPVAARSNGRYTPEALWYRRFYYEEERRRGYDHTEDLLSPGVFEFELRAGEALLVLSAGADPWEAPSGQTLQEQVRLWRKAERERRQGAASPRELAADSFLVRRGTGASIIAGYPWFGDWGRDCFIALRGICLARGRFKQAASILLEWARHRSQGMLPNRFPEEGEPPEYNSVDASLWFVVAAGELLQACEQRGAPIQEEARRELKAAMLDVLRHYRGGTRFGIQAEPDALLRAGEEGSQLTWMDATAGGQAVTPRVGKPVEVQALWINALHLASKLDPSFKPLMNRARASFKERFINPKNGALFDVVDVNHEAGRVDASFRPNQILAVGGLGQSLLHGLEARRVVDLVQEKLWTCLGLRTLDPADPRYLGRYVGDAETRNKAYHQGTVWPWLLGPFVEAWVRTHGNHPKARRLARRQFLGPLLERIAPVNLGQLPEIADGDAPHQPRGCPFQAWSVAEILRLETMLAPSASAGQTPALRPLERAP